jgi:hypothetical protein
MTEFNYWVEMAKALGLPAAVLFAWWYHNREQNKLWGQMLESNKSQTAEMMKLNGDQAKQTLDNYKAQAGQMLDNTNKIWSSVIDMIRQQLNQQNEVLKGLLENDSYHGAQLARMENKIDTNQQCPLIKKEQQK